MLRRRLSRPIEDRENIGVDLDGVVADTYPAAFELLKKMYPENINTDAKYIPSLSWEHAYGLKRQQIVDFFIESGKEGIFREIPPFADAKESLEKISEQYNIFIISYREYIPNARNDTLYWLDTNKISYYKLMLTKNKFKVALKEKLVLFVDDNTAFCNKVANTSVPTYFLLRHPNKESVVQLKDLNPLVKIVRGFKEIENILII